MSCSTISKTKEKLDFLNQKIDTVKEYSEAKLVELEKKADKTEADLAGVGIKLDENDDGKVTKEEAIAAAKEVARGALTDSEKRKMLTDSEFWGGLAAAIATPLLAAIGLSKRRRKNAEIEELRKGQSAPQ